MSDLQRRLQHALGDSYRIERELGGGGMSRVFLATEASLRRQVVVKILPPEFASEVSAARFRQEIELAAGLQHPNILPVLTAGAKDDLLFYVMPFVPGESLRHRLTREGKLPVADAVRILREIADALACAHAEGVIHRDIKPENILLEGGHAVLTDFGVARALAESRSGGRLTETGFAVGTPGYMSPEQAAGERNLDARADVYALAVVGYEMLAGFPPFSGPTAQAVLAAHLTETPKPLGDLRPETPPEVSNTIARALAKNPNARLRTAAELRDAVAGAMAPRTARRMQPALWGSLAVLVAVGAWLLVPRSRASLDANLVVVVPFDVLAPKLELWREGLMDVLSRNLDGAGPLRAVSPTLAMRRWGGRADATSARDLGGRVGAGLVVFGQLVGTQGDSARLSANLVDASSGRTLAEVELRDLAGNMDRLTDSLTIALLRALGRTRPISAVRVTALGSRSLPALKAFLQGEQLFRRSAWDSALAYYQRAVDADPTFALALGRIGLSLGWIRNGTDSISNAYSVRAGSFNHGLAPRDSLLVTADSLAGVMFRYVADPLFYQHRGRLFGTLEEAARRYPADPEVWYALGDARFHFDAGPGSRGPTLARAAFDRSIALDSAFTPAYIHPFALTLSAQDSASARRYARRYLALAPTDAEGTGIRVGLPLLDHASTSAATARMLDSVPVDYVISARSAMARWLDTAEIAVRLARVAARRGQSAVFDSAFLRQRLAEELAFRGHVREAYALGRNVPRLFGELTVLGAVPAEMVAAKFANSHFGANWPGAPLLWWTAHRDTAEIKRVIRETQAVGAGAEPGLANRARFVHAWAEASLALARGDSAEGERRFRVLPDSLMPLATFSWLARAQLLEARGRAREALPFAEASMLIPAPPLQGLFVLEAARLHERLGDRIEALADYRYVADVWRNADLELKPYVDDARAALKRLGGERRP